MTGLKSFRQRQWLKFAEKVADHVENYTVKQYGDWPNDNVEQWSVEDCLTAIKKYCARRGKNLREGNDKLDLLKIAHYACLAYDKMEGK